MWDNLNMISIYNRDFTAISRLEKHGSVQGVVISGKYVSVEKG